MRTFLTVVTTILVAGAGEAHAANLAVIAQPPTILNLVVLIVSAVAAVVCFGIVGAVKGGQMQRAWQIFMFGFVLLALSQITMLLPVFEIVALPIWISPALMAGCLALLTYGVVEVKRVLA